MLNKNLYKIENIFILINLEERTLQWQETALLIYAGGSIVVIKVRAEKQKNYKYIF